MAAQKKYPDELRERAVKMLFEVREREGLAPGRMMGSTHSSTQIIPICMAADMP